MCPGLWADCREGPSGRPGLGTLEQQGPGAMSWSLQHYSRFRALSASPARDRSVLPHVWGMHTDTQTPPHTCTHSETRVHLYCDAHAPTETVSTQA